MITASSAFNAANAALVKQPIWLLQIGGYGRAFSNADLGSVVGLPHKAVIQKASNIKDFGGGELFNSQLDFSENVTAGNLLFVFTYNASSETTASLSIDDTAGNTWHAIYQDTRVVGWYAISNATGPATLWVSGSTHGFIAGGNFEIYAIEVDSSFSGFHAAGASGSGSPASVTAGSTTISFPVNASSAWNLILVELAPAAGSSLAIDLLFARVSLSGVGGVIAGASLVTGAAASGVYAAVGAAATAPWLVSIDPLKITVSDLDGSADLGDLVFNVQDRGQAITADLASFTFEGKQCQLLHGFVGMDLADYLTMFIGVIDTVDCDNFNLEYKFTVSDVNLKKLTQAIYTQSDADVHGNTFAVDSTHVRTLNGHPLDMLVDALQQAGVDISDIDTAKIYYYRDFIFSGVNYEFSLTSAPVAKDFLEAELMKPMGMYLRSDNLGKLTVSSFYPSAFPFGGYTPPTPPVMTFDVTTPTDVPIELEAPLINQVIFRFDDDGSGSTFLSEQVVDWDASIAKYGLVDAQIIESKGMRASFQGYFMAAVISRLIFLRYGQKNLTLDPLSLIWSACLLEPGDIIALTNPYLPDRVAGVLGVTTQIFEVLDRNWDFMDGIVELKLLALDLSKFKEYLITTNGEAGYAAASTGDKAALMFLSDGSGEYSTTAAGNTLG